MLRKNETKPMLVSLINIFLAFFFSLIILIPMGLYISQYNKLASDPTTTQLEWAKLAQDTGYDKAGSLSSSLIIGILGCGLAFATSSLWLKFMAKYSPSILSDNQLKFPKLIAIFLIIEIISLLVGFFIAWLVPIWNTNSQLNNAQDIAYKRIIIYAAIGGTLGLGFGLFITGAVIYSNFRISYYAAQNNSTY